VVLDFFAGSGATGAACLLLDRRFILVDDNPAALEIMARRFRGVEDIEWVGYDPTCIGGNSQE
jgi:site-specific DNA-methyltransferase (adenine-specific)